MAVHFNDFVFDMILNKNDAKSGRSMHVFDTGKMKFWQNEAQGLCSMIRSPQNTLMPDCRVMSYDFSVGGYGLGFREAEEGK